MNTSKILWIIAAVAATTSATVALGQKPLPATTKSKAAVRPPQKGTFESGAYNWQNVPIVGGGFVSGIILHPGERGLMYARTDIGGAYRWDTKAKRWVSLSDWVTSDTWNYTGIESIGVDPSDPKRLYIAAGTYTNDWAGNGAILRSADKGATWKIKPLPFKLGGNEDGRFAGERLAVDPGNGAVLFLGTRRNGLWKSTNRGETWAQVAAFPVPTTPNGVGIAFVLYDGRGVKRGATTQTIYAGVSDKGASLYRSTDGGATWQAVPGQPTGLMPSHGVWDANGDLYLSYGDAAGPNGMTAGAVHRFEPKTGVWTDVTPEKGSFGYGGIAADPKRAGVLLVCTMDRWSQKDEIFRTRDGGKSWEAIGQKSKRDASLAPWLTWGKPGEADAGHWMGDIEIDPFDANHALYVTGTGIWTTNNLGNSDGGKPALWTVGAVGLEECVVLELVSPSSGTSLLSVVGDINGFRHDTFTASPTGGFFLPSHGTNLAIDFAEADPNIVVRLFGGDNTNGASSADNGRSWTPFPAKPPFERGDGKIAVSADGKTWIYVAERQAGAAITRDKGATWAMATGLPARFTRVVSDRVDANRFYAFDETTGSLLASSDGGATFAPTGAVLPTGSGFLRAAPGKSGDLWLVGDNGIHHSTDGGATFSSIGGMENGRRIGFGKAAPGRTNPAAFVAGKKSGVYGFYRSDDNGTTWVRINDDAHQFAGINSVTGDPRVYGRVYIASQSRGILRGDLPNAAKR